MRRAEIGIRKNSGTGLLLGVCSGISEWSGRQGLPVPVLAVRLLFVLGTLFSLGLACCVYLFLANTLSDESECNDP